MPNRRIIYLQKPSQGSNFRTFDSGLSSPCMRKPKLDQNPNVPHWPVKAKGASPPTGITKPAGACFPTE